MGAAFSPDLVRWPTCPWPCTRDTSRLLQRHPSSSRAAWIASITARGAAMPSPRPPTAPPELGEAPANPVIPMVATVRRQPVPRLRPLHLEGRPRLLVPLRHVPRRDFPPRLPPRRASSSSRTTWPTGSIAGCSCRMASSPTRRGRACERLTSCRSARSISSFREPPPRHRVLSGHGLDPRPTTPLPDPPARPVQLRADGVGSLHARRRRSSTPRGRCIAFFNVKEGRPSPDWNDVMTFPACSPRGPTAPSASSPRPSSRACGHGRVAPR